MVIDKKLIDSWENQMAVLAKLQVVGKRRD